MIRMLTGWMAVGLAAGMAGQAVGQVAQTQPATPIQPTATAPAPSTMPDSQAIEEQLLEQLEENPLVRPTQRRPTEPVNPGGPSSIGPAGVDPRVLGVVPGQDPPKLRREGEFIVSRRGRLVRAPNARHILFVFEADSDTAPEPPMVMTACQMLQNMEEIIRERGDKVVFIVSGQVLVYRGANYLLPTMMKLAIDYGNLDH